LFSPNREWVLGGLFGKVDDAGVVGLGELFGGEDLGVSVTGL